MTDHEEINVRLTAIETKIDIVLDQHDSRLDKVEAALGKRGLITAVFTAVGVGIGAGAAWMAKFGGGGGQ